MSDFSEPGNLSGGDQSGGARMLTPLCLLPRKFRGASCGYHGAIGIVKLQGGCLLRTFYRQALAFILKRAISRCRAQRETFVLGEAFEALVRVGVLDTRFFPQSCARNVMRRSGGESWM